MVELTSPRKIYPLPSRLWQGKVKLKRLRAESIHPLATTPQQSGATMRAKPKEPAQKKAYICHATGTEQSAQNLSAARTAAAPPRAGQAENQTGSGWGVAHPRPGPVWPFGAERRGQKHADRHHHRWAGRRFGRGALVRQVSNGYRLPPHSWLYAAAAGTVRQLYRATLSCLHGRLERNPSKSCCSRG